MPRQIAEFNVKTKKTITRDMTPAEEARLFPVPHLNEAKTSALARVRALSQKIRAKYVTDLSGQEMIYLRKEQEARAYVVAGRPDDLTAYPFIAAEVGITGQTAADVAAEYVSQAERWTAVGSQLEAMRLGAIKGIEGAADVAEVDAALSAFHTAMEDVFGVT